ncbi:MAG: GNAT family N-acetyltransferase [Butyrivibrio sp.]|nr:GNAT family N-acetyltransferase [Butyrivibrio sp.]
MQVDAFKGLLAKYHDHDMSPAAESYERIMQKFDFKGTTYYFIVADGKRVGGIRIIDKKDGSRKRISPIWIMPEFRNLGFAQQAILEAERIYGEDNWSLDTILQEKGNLHLYEKLGYRQTGKIEKISDIMDIVYYEKN